MAFTQTDLDNIKEAIASGVQQATIQGEMVTYRSLAEMMKIKALIEADLDPAGPGVGISISQPTLSRGF